MSVLHYAEEDDGYLPEISLNLDAPTRTTLSSGKRGVDICCEIESCCPGEKMIFGRTAVSQLVECIYSVVSFKHSIARLGVDVKVR